jgi:hypothetical protein
MVPAYCTTLPEYSGTWVCPSANACPLASVGPISKRLAPQRLGPELHAKARRILCKCTVFRHLEGWDSRVRGIRVFDYEDTASRDR